MKEIIRQYGTGVIAVIIMSGLLTIVITVIGGSGKVFEAAGKSSMSYSSVGDYYDELRNRKIPKAEYLWERQVSVGELVNLSDLLVARFEDGSEAKCEVYAMKDMEGQLWQLQESGQYSFDRSGEYTLFFYVTGYSGKLYYGKMQLPVNSRRKG